MKKQRLLLLVMILLAYSILDAKPIVDQDEVAAISFLHFNNADGEGNMYTFEKESSIEMTGRFQNPTTPIWMALVCRIEIGGESYNMEFSDVGMSIPSDICVFSAEFIISKMVPSGSGHLICEIVDRDTGKVYASTIIDCKIR